MTDNTFLLKLFPWIPRPLIVLALLGAAVVAAVVVHSLVWAVFSRVFGKRYPLLHMIIDRTRALSLFAFIMIALSLAMPIAPLHARVTEAIDRCLLAAFIVFVGWLVIVAANILMDRYMGRFRLDASDNLLARKAVTQVRLLQRTVDTVLVILTIGLALMSFDSVRQFGISLFASAGLAGIAAGLAARPLLENLIAGLQIAFTQPLRLDDVLIVEGEYGTVEEINSTYVVLKLWDWRRMIVPLSYFFDKPFQNWTRSSAALMGTVMIYTDYTVPVDKVRKKLEEIVRSTKLWDHQVANLQVTDAKDNVIELRALVSASNSSNLSDLRSLVREQLIAFLQRELSDSLPVLRQRPILDPASNFAAASPHAGVAQMQ
ncbi:MAG: mechanosensitive ion channel family protein [Alphaproteobacteria bacterium]|nr:mechanosensitive ion channel family protein [Alphaproteobacteria bacterium]MBV9903080.1 mechanosensitive ion channel family protein [Alphaproteobacteria bacterium]